MQKFSEELKSLHAQSVKTFVDQTKEEIRNAALEGERWMSIRIDNEDFHAAVVEMIQSEECLSIEGGHGFYIIRWNI